MTTHELIAPRIAALRAYMASHALDALIIPHDDEHLGEYLPAEAERLAWATGFTGSAGFAILLAEKAALFVDGQAKAVFDGHTQLGEGARVGQHEADADLGALGTHDLGQQKTGGCGGDQGRAAGQDEAAGTGHGSLLLFRLKVIYRKSVVPHPMAYPRC